MRLIKGFIFVLAGLFIMITLISLLMPSKVMTVRAVVVHADHDLILSQINDLKKWKDWHPVFMSDSSNVTISTPSIGVNAFVTWNTNGKENKFLITESDANHIKATLMRSGENDVANIISINPINYSTAVQVEWRVLTTLKWYPWEKFYGIFIDKLSGPGYEFALNNLKELAEKR
ncbi:MAG: hypothetical protein ABI402_08095 [Ferruginibacter sp.]